jgi:hypothetical protein
VATLHFIGEKWLVNSVPTSFVRTSVGAAQADLQKATSAIERSPARKQIRDALQKQFDVSLAAAAGLKEAVEKGDRRSVAESVRRFAAADRILHQLRQQQERQ